MRWRNLVLLLVLVALFYALGSRQRKTQLVGKLREVGRALVLALIVYWIWMLGSFAFRSLG